MDYIPLSMIFQNLNPLIRRWFILSHNTLKPVENVYIFASHETLRKDDIKFKHMNIYYIFQKFYFRRCKTSSINLFIIYLSYIRIKNLSKAIAAYLIDYKLIYHANSFIVLGVYVRL